MLVLSRKRDEKINCVIEKEQLDELIAIVNKNGSVKIVITAVEITPTRTRIGIDAPKCVNILRNELQNESTDAAKEQQLG